MQNQPPLAEEVELPSTPSAPARRLYGLTTRGVCLITDLSDRLDALAHSRVARSEFDLSADAIADLRAEVRVLKILGETLTRHVATLAERAGIVL